MLSKIEQLAILLNALTYDPFLSDLLSEISTAKLRKQNLQNLVQGYILYSKGRKAYADANYDLADQLLRKSLVRLYKSSSVFALRASFALGCALHFEAKRSAALAVLNRTERESRSRGYTALHAETLWMRGLIRFSIGDLGEAESSYNAALLDFGGIGETDSAAGIHFLLVEALDYQGVRDRTWLHCYEALHQLIAIGDPLRRYQIHSVAATASFHMGCAELAVLTQNLAVVDARLAHNPSALTASLTWRATYEINLGKRHEADVDLAEAKKVALMIPGKAARSRALGDILLAVADLYRDERPNEIIRSLSQAEIQHGAAGARYHQIELLLARARAYRSIGKDLTALKDLKKAVLLIEARRGTIMGDWTKISFLDRERVVYNDIVSVLMGLNYLTDAFNYMERGRARVLLDLITRLPHTENRLVGKFEGPLKLHEIARSLPSDVYMIEFSVIQDRIFIWLVGPRGLLAANDVRIDDELKALANSAVNYGWEDLVGDDRAKDILYGKLLGSPLKRVPSQSLVVIVPDAFLNGISFGALEEYASSHPVMEDYPIVYAASASVYIRSVRLSRERGSTPLRSIVLAGDPAFDRSRFPSLTRLPLAVQEATALRRFYPSSLVLLGENAKKDVFTERAATADVAQYSGHLLSNLDDPLS
jgi:tetratricopeptide (TPR) repeat protein